MKLEFEIEIDGVGDVVRVAGLIVAGMALYRELAKPPEARTWHGEVAGVVPYDFRPPTLERVRDSMWNPDNPSLFTRTIFGVGWGINIPVLAQNVGRLAQNVLCPLK